MSRTAAIQYIFSALLIAASLAFAGCSTAPYRAPSSSGTTPPSGAPVATDAGIAIAQRAQLLVGARYRYGGSGPDAFDCSGLVHYVHTELGIPVPRTAAEQMVAASPVERAALRPGDLVFFRDPGPTITHVGVYTGDGVFVHAPKTGRNVSYASIYQEYYRENFAGAGRLYPVR